MIVKDSLSCPVDFVTVNENKVRLIALQVFIVSIAIFIFQHWLLIILLTVDFFLRSFDLNKFSPLAAISAGIIRLFSIGVKPINQGPKRFAARIGLIFSIAILLSYYADYPTVVASLAAVLIMFSFLESFFSFCAGCHVYTYSKKIFNI
jgi:hypothetical protein